MGYRPIWFDRTDLGSSLPTEGRATISAVALLLVLSIVVAGALAGLHMGYERGVHTAVDETFSEPQYEDLTLVSVQSQYRGWSGASPNVSVTVSRTTNKNYSTLPSTLERRIEQRTGRDVRVTVQYTESQSADTRALEFDRKRVKETAGQFRMSPEVDSPAATGRVNF